MPQIELPQEAIDIAKAISNAKGESILVGGTVRDYFLSKSISKDLDIEIYHLPPSTLENILSKFGKVSTVGKSFGVFKLSSAFGEYDFSLPRTESKIGKGHKGFQVNHDPHIRFEQAASRRDFTLNAIGYNILTEEILDPFDGLQHLKEGILHHIGPSFSEDPLRVLRAMQFVGRFEFKIAPPTIKLCQSLDLRELPKERIFEEFKKLFLISKRPSLGLAAAREIGILKYFPELKALIDIPQDPEWHPEGDVWIHTLMVIDEAARLQQGDHNKDLCLMLGALCHDFGKPETTILKDNRWRSPSHDVKGLIPTESFLGKLTNEQSLIDLVKIYVKEHLKPAQLYNERHQVTDGAIRRLALKVSIPELVRVATADHFGRTTQEAIERQFPAGDWLLKRAENLKVKQKAPQPFLRGRDLLLIGMNPGPDMGELIQKSFELQLDGELSCIEDSIQWAEEQLKKLAS